MYVALNSSRAYVYNVAKACDAGKTTRFDAAGAILLASENAVRVANEAVQALGGAGYTKDWPVERYYRDASLLEISGKPFRGTAARDQFRWSAGDQCVRAHRARQSPHASARLHRLPHAEADRPEPL